MRGAKNWTEGSDNIYTRRFGPITATVSRFWDYRDDGPTEYRGFLSCGEETFAVRIASLGVDWFDDKCPALAIRELEKQMKAAIRNWTK
jgi:hypothetical protein